MLTAKVIAQGFVDACHAELQALKPGNVHVHAAGHGMEVAQFEAAAAAAAPYIADHALKVGTRIRSAVEASWAATGCNTNLGILLLCAPLACAAETTAPDETLRTALARVLAHLDDEDAGEAFAAIAYANPAGLGSAPEGDVHLPPAMSLLEAMRLGAPRDRIANAYATGFADIFDFALPTLRQARAAGSSAAQAVTALHMAVLSRFPDSHIARKHGIATAEAVRAEAAALAAFASPSAGPAGVASLMKFDNNLKAHGLNPGTTADFVVATLFTDVLNNQLAAG